jgi:hypothetical protein
VSQRTARIVAGSIVAVAVALLVTSVTVGLTTFPRQRAGQIVVVPTDRTSTIRAAAGALDPRRDCQGRVLTSDLLGDAPVVYCQLEVDRRAGADFNTDWGAASSCSSSASCGSARGR